MIKKYEDLLMRIYFVDKTPVYTYEGKNSLTTEKHKSFRGSRWCTPREIIKDCIGPSFWDKYRKHCEKGKKQREKET